MLKKYYERAKSAQDLGFINQPELDQTTVPIGGDVALVQTATLTALVQTGTLTALIQTS